MENLTEKILTALIEKTEKGEIQWSRDDNSSYSLTSSAFKITIKRIVNDGVGFEIWHHTTGTVCNTYANEHSIRSTTPAILKLRKCIEEQYEERSRSALISILESLEAPKPSSTPPSLNSNP
jgi:hypothetical protein